MKKMILIPVRIDCLFFYRDMMYGFSVENILWVKPFKKSGSLFRVKDVGVYHSSLSAEEIVKLVNEAQ